LGGIAHKPWRASKLEASLKGRPATNESFLAAAEEELAGSKPLSHNAFKVELAKRTIVAVLAELAGEVA
jgi:xanthine dehydrogenase YagS FAD-binding subunit